MQTRADTTFFLFHFLFSFEFFLVLDTVALSFLFYNYYLIMDQLGSKDSYRGL